MNKSKQKLKLLNPRRSLVVMATSRQFSVSESSSAGIFIWREDD